MPASLRRMCCLLIAAGAALRAPAGRPVTIVFSGQNPLGGRGRAMSRDGGATWQWLGQQPPGVPPDGTAVTPVRLR